MPFATLSSTSRLRPLPSSGLPTPCYPDLMTRPGMAGSWCRVRSYPRPGTLRTTPGSPEAPDTQRPFARPEQADPGDSRSPTVQPRVPGPPYGEPSADWCR